MEEMENAVENLPNKRKIIVEANNTEKYLNELSEQIDKRKSDLETESTEYHDTVHKSVDNLTETGGGMATKLFGGTNEAI